MKMKPKQNYKSHKVFPILSSAECIICKRRFIFEIGYSDIFNRKFVCKTCCNNNPHKADDLFDQHSLRSRPKFPPLSSQGVISRGVLEPKTRNKNNDYITRIEINETNTQ